MSQDNKPKPSVGRIVHYHTYPGEQPWAAIISRVWPDGLVDLTCFPPVEFAEQEEFAPGRASCASAPWYSKKVPFSEEVMPGTWSWPPRT